MDSQMVVAMSCVKVLRLYGFSYKKLTFWSMLRIFLVLLVFHIVTIGIWGHVIYFIGKYRRGEKKFSFEDLGEDAAAIITSYLAFYFELVYSSRCHRMENLLRDAGNFENHEKPDGFEKIMSFSDKVCKHSFQFLYASMVGLWVFSLLQTCEDGVVDDCGLLVAGYLPFDIFYTPARQIFAAIQSFSGINTGIATIAICLALMLTMQSLVLQVRHLQAMLMKIPNMSTRKERKAQIKNLTKECSKAGEPFFFAMVFLASMAISLTSYQLLAIKLKYITLIHLSAYLIVCFFICVFGETLITEGENLFNTIYECVPWDGDNATANDLYLMMMMSVKDLFIEAGKFGPVGHIRFMLMMKGTYSFLTLILNV